MSINKATIFGNLGRDPEVSYTAAGKAITKLNVATTENWIDSQGQPQERTEWHRITFFEKQAETVGKSFKKGHRIYLEGKLQTSQYEKDGETRYSTEIIGKFLSSSKRNKISPIIMHRGLFSNRRNSNTRNRNRNQVFLLKILRNDREQR
jgi:single stranded DNA-binding protein (ssb)